MHLIRSIQNLLLGAACLVAFNGRSAVADQLRIFVADYQENNVSSFDTSGNLIWSQPLVSAVGLAFDSSKVLHAASYTNGVIERFNPVTGAPLGTVVSGNPGIGGVAIDPSDNIYTVNYDSKELLRFNSSGTQLGSPISVAPVTPDLGIAYDPNTSEIVVGGWNTKELLRFTTAGVSVSSSTLTNLTYGIEGIAFDSQGNMYIADSNPVDGPLDSGFIQKYDSAGNYVGVFAGFDMATVGLAVDAQDNLYVTLVGDAGSYVAIYDPTATQTGMFLSGTYSYGIAVLTVPEPSSAMLALIALTSVCGIYRRRLRR